jgi:hypothetical protein
MGEKLVRFSDLSGQMAEDPEALVSVVVTDHPEIDQSVRLEAMPGELEMLGKLALKDPVVLDVTPPDEEEAQRYVLTVVNFNKLATHRPMAEVLEDAKPVVPPRPQRRSHNTTASGEPLRNYNDPDWAGLPHKGKVGEAEAAFVRDNLELVNQRRVAAGHTPVNPANAADAKRYGLEATNPH